MRVSPAIAAPISLLDNPAVSEAFASRLDATSKTPIAVAFSGGGDSLALLVAAKDWACRVRRPVLAFHVDHGLQAASGEWASFAEQVCGELGVRFQKFDWTGPKPATGLPAAARAARHRLIADAAREAGCCAILVGHTADDVLEGDLIRAETPGLGCLTEWSPSPVWPEGRGLFHFRPLLSVRRETLRDYLIAGDWRWIDDPANDDPAYARARARRLLSSPVQRSETGEGDHAQHGGGGERQAPVSGARPLHPPSGGPPPPLRGGGTEGFAAAILCAAGGSRPPNRESVERVRARLEAGEPFTATLAGARIEGRNDQATIYRDAGAYTRFGAPILDLQPNSPAVWDGRFEITASEPDWSVRPLKGLSKRLPAPERARLAAIPAAARPALPLGLHADGRAACPILAEEGLAQISPVSALWLGGARLDAARGCVQTEAAAAKAPHGERGPGVLSWGLNDE